MFVCFLNLLNFIVVLNNSLYIKYTELMMCLEYILLEGLCFDFLLEHSSTAAFENLASKHMHISQDRLQYARVMSEM